jgi:hypothetical protein
MRWWQAKNGTRTWSASCALTSNWKKKSSARAACRRGGALRGPARIRQSHLIREQTRAEWGWSWLENLLRDLRIGVRTLLAVAWFFNHCRGCDGVVHRRCHIAVYNRALGLAQAASFSRSRPAGDAVRAFPGGGSTGDFNYNPLHQRTSTTGARRPTVLKTWPSCATPDTT